MAHPTKTLLLASCAWLVSCATTGPAPASGNRVDLDSYLLLAELAREREQFDEAAAHYLDAARVSDQPALAEIAAEIAQQLDLTELGLQAAERWRELRPSDPRVHQFLGVFRLRDGDSRGAVEEFEALIAGAQDPVAALALSIEILAGERDVAGATAVVAALVANHPGPAEGHYGLARLALRNGDFELALENAERAVEINPEWVEAQLLYARTLLIAGRTEDGLRLAEQFAAEETDLELRLQYAELLLSAGHGGEARTLLDAILAENPGLPEAVRALAFLTLTENELDAAREYFNELRAEPRYRDEAFYYLGRIAESEEQTLQAMRFYSRVTQGNNAVEAQLRAANLLYNSMGDQEGALQHLREFGIANPDYRTEMLVAQGEVLLQMDRTEAAQELLREALEAAPEDETLHQANAQLYVVLAQRAINEEDLGGAQRILRDALDEYPGDTSLRYAQALLYQEQGRLRRAVTALQSLVSEQPDDAGLLNALGYLLTDELDRHEEARGYIQRALAGEPDNPAIIDSMGWVLFNLGEYEAALEYLERAYRLFPDPEVAAHIVDTQWALGNTDEALELLRQSLEEHPDSPHLQEVGQRLAP